MVPAASGAEAQGWSVFLASQMEIEMNLFSLLSTGWMARNKHVLSQIGIIPPFMKISPILNRTLSDLLVLILLIVTQDS